MSKDEELTDHQIRHLVVLERIFLSAKEMEESKSQTDEEKMDEDKKPEEEEKEETEEMRAEREAQAEVTKQKLLVNYLKVSAVGSCFLFL